MRKSLVLAAARLLRASGASRFLGARYRGAGTILRLHSIVRDPAFHLYDQTRTSAAFLERFCRWLRRSGLEVLTLDQALARLLEPGQTSERGRFAVITLDDGYADNLTLGLPIFEQFGLPITVYVTTGMVTRQMSFWWGGLQALLRERDAVEIEPMARRFACPDLPAKRRALGEIAAWVQGDLAARSAQLDRCLARNGIDTAALLDGEALTGTQLRTLAAHPLVAIGGHTVSHPKLAQLPMDQAREEMRANRDWLADLTGREIAHFAYPFGDATSCGAREARLAAEIGFKSAVTTRLGNLFPEHARHLHALPRAGFTADTESLGYMAAMIDGTVQRIRSGGAPAVATL